MHLRIGIKCKPRTKQPTETIEETIAKTFEGKFDNFSESLKKLDTKLWFYFLAHSNIFQNRERMFRIQTTVRENSRNSIQ